jgi:hypothetical protein
MKVYSDIITEPDVQAAFADARRLDGADIHITDLRTFRPRAGWRTGWEFFAGSVSGTRASGHRAIGSYPLDEVPRAASWDAYGYVIARLYQVDPAARIGPYGSRGDFIGRVLDLAASRRSEAPFLALVGA